ncbi:hypothetical protein NPIL_490411 [Nephila pilipes]|uniref:Uncharacterized protein n=1 Tax=Nephila pilipes TaxID=299642 RepID=A0A8X6K3G0_NEPPI|nr:hypothetical protein NPIL_490411 [Nephila pilipes]
MWANYPHGQLTFQKSSSYDCKSSISIHLLTYISEDLVDLVSITSAEFMMADFEVTGIDLKNDLGKFHKRRKFRVKLKKDSRKAPKGIYRIVSTSLQCKGI